jgi:hypothetical protein
MQRNLGVMAAELFKFQAIGGVPRVLVGGVVAVVANGTLQGKKRTIAFWHYFSPSSGIISAA